VTVLGVPVNKLETVQVSFLRLVVLTVALFVPKMLSALFVIKSN